MSTAVIASVRAIAQAHAAFSGAAFGAVLFADGGIESQRGNRPNNETEQSDHRNELGHRCLPLVALSLVAPCAYFYPKRGHLQIQKGPLRGLPGIELTIKISGVKWTQTAKVIRRGNAVVLEVMTKAGRLYRSTSFRLTKKEAAKLAAELQKAASSN
jgi:hypothetical protein